jgi:hypothetical protein
MIISGTAGQSRKRTRLAVALVAVLVLMGVSPVTPFGGAAGAATPPTTVRGTASGAHAWDAVHHRPFAATPSVTVDQTTNLTDQVVHVTWSHFTPSVDPAGDFFTAGQTYYAVTVLECRGTNPASPRLWKWPDFGPDCYNYTAANSNAAHGVGNQMYALTGPDGAGEAYFHVETAVTNDALGCDSTHACSLVVVPNWGGVQNPGARPTDPSVHCNDHTGDVGLVFGDYALDTSLGGACSWRDRIVVPLRFAPTPQACPGHDFAFVAEGAPVLARAISQWRTGWCTGASGLSFDFDSGTNEDLARQAFLSGSAALTNSVDVAIVNRPADGATTRKFVYAPISNSAITIAYHIDDARTGKLISRLVLDARLVAKLVTQSYSLAFGCTDGVVTTKQSATCDPAVKGNAPDIFDDPEFRKLNPRIPRTALPTVSLLNRGQFLPLVVSGNSDLVYQLTSWLWSDPSARAFLKGKADPWGMHVNSYYRHQPMPTSQFQVLDPGYTAPAASNGVPGQSTMQVTWNPISGLGDVASSLVIDRPSGIDPVLPSCGSSAIPCVYQRFGPQPAGKRAMFAIVGSIDAAADRFPTARLINARGAAVAAGNAGMRAALRHAHTDRDGVTQRIDYVARDAAAYPLTTVDYAMVPTCGLSTVKATAISHFLRLVANSQRPGLLAGELAPGQLPLTHAQRAQTLAAAARVSSAGCVAATPNRTHTHVGRASTQPTIAQPQQGVVPNANAPAPATPTAAARTSVAPTSPVSSQAPSASTSQAAYGIKDTASPLNTKFVLPAALALLALLFVLGPLAVVSLNGGKATEVWARVRKGLHR